MRLARALFLAAPFLAAALLLPACAAARPPGGAGAPSTRALFDALRSLQGDWRGTYDERGSGGDVATRFELTAGGTAVRELLFPGQPGELMNVYHLDGDSLLVTHYCDQGNQPRLRARRMEGGRIEFTLDSVTNRKSPDALVMGELVLELVDRDHLIERWRAVGPGAPARASAFRFTRLGGRAPGSAGGLAAGAADCTPLRRSGGASTAPSTRACLRSVPGASSR